MIFSDGLRVKNS